MLCINPLCICSELVMDVLRQQPSKDEYEEACLMIFGIPVVGPERVGKLRTVLTKVFTNVEPDHKAHFPLTEDGGSKVSSRSLSFFHTAYVLFLGMCVH